MTTRDRPAADAAVPGLVFAALVPMGVLHTTAAAAVDPSHEPISGYVVAPGGAALLGASALAPAAAGLVPARRVRAAGLPRPAVGLLAPCSAALVLVGAFPTNAPAAPPDVVAAHRYAVVHALVTLPLACLPLACLLVARRAHRLPWWTAPAPQPAGWAAAVAVLGGVLVPRHAPTAPPGAPGSPALGAVQRVLYRVVLVLLAATGRAVRVVATGHRTAPGSRIGEPAAALGGAA